MAFFYEFGSILGSPTRDELIEEAKDYMEAAEAGVNPRGWTEASIAYQFTAGLAQMVRSVLDRLESEWLKQVFLSTATGAFLTNLAWEMARKTRKDPQSTVVSLTLSRDTDTHPSGDVTISSLPLCWAEGSNGRRLNYFYSGTYPVTIPDGESSVYVTYTAEFEGKRYNVAPSAISNLETSVTGVSGVTNQDDGDHAWLVTAGADKEGDESLRARALAALDTGRVPPVEVYEALALSVAGVESAEVRAPSPWAPSTVLVVVGAGGSPCSQNEMDRVQAALEAGGGVTDRFVVVTYSEYSISLTVDVYLELGSGVRDEAAIEAAIDDRVRALFDDELAEGEGVDPYLPGKDVSESLITNQILASAPDAPITRVLLTGSPAFVDGRIVVPDNKIAALSSLTVNIEEEESY